MTSCPQFASRTCPLLDLIQAPSGDCQGCVKLQAELAVIRSDMQALRDKNAALLELVQELARAIKEGKQ